VVRGRAYLQDVPDLVNGGGVGCALVCVHNQVLRQACYTATYWHMYHLRLLLATMIRPTLA
jgi:hypothetical protein